MSTENNKRIAKNTLLLYFRMFFTMAISFYTSRIILNVLGVTDFGIYNIVGGIVTMFAFINSSLSGATSRFLTFELGRENLERLKRVFSGALTIHIGVSLLIVLLAETIGLWFLQNKLVIPVNRMHIAVIVYQLSVASIAVSVTQIPYNAAIIAHEKMNVYAYVSIIEVSLKLFVVYLIQISKFDKLMIFGILIFALTTIIALIYRFYCVSKFAECKYKFAIDKEILKPILLFSGYDLYGNFSWRAGTQGVIILLNMFFGAAINAATAIASQLQNAIGGFSNNFLTAVRPQIVKYYAVDDFNNLQTLIINSSKFSYLISLFFTLPLILENNFVLKMWLKIVPDYAIIFNQIALINNLILVVFASINYAIHATGNIKRISFITGSIYLLGLPLSYLFLRNGSTPVLPFITINILTVLITNFYNLFVLKKYINEFSISYFVKEVLLKCLLITAISSILPLLVIYYLPIGWVRLLIVVFTSISSICIFTYFFLLDKQTKNNAIALVLDKICMK